MKHQQMKLLILALGALLGAPISSASTLDMLRDAAQSNPDNNAIYYYLGMAEDQAGNELQAVNALSRYVASAPRDARTQALRERLLILRQSLARAEAKSAVQSGAVDAAQVDRLAVLEFDVGDDDPRLAFFSKALNATLITDLAKVPQISVVERTQMQAMMSEVRLGQTGLINAETSIQIGALLQADKIDWGTAAGSTGGSVRIENSVSETTNNEVLGQFSLENDVQQFYDLQKELVFGILKTLGIEKDQLPPEVLEDVSQKQTENLDAFLAFGRGLERLDAGDYAAADAAFKEAVSLDPEFDSAEQAEIETPDSADTDNTVVLAEADDTSGESASEEADNVEADGAAEDTAQAEAETATQIADLATEASTGTIETEPEIFKSDDGFIIAALSYSDDEYSDVSSATAPLTVIDKDLTDWTASYPSVGQALDGTGTLSELTSLRRTRTIQGEETTVWEANQLPSVILTETTSEQTYSKWGLWSVEGDVFVDEDGSANADENIIRYALQNGFFVSGTRTSADQLQALAASSSNNIVSYSGEAAGYYMEIFVEPGAMLTGNFYATVNFSELSIYDFTLDVSSEDHFVTISNGSGLFNSDGSATLFANWSTSSPYESSLYQSSYIYAGLYGPDASELGGIFGIEFIGDCADCSPDAYFYGAFLGNQDAEYGQGNVPQPELSKIGAPDGNEISPAGLIEGWGDWNGALPSSDLAGGISMGDMDLERATLEQRTFNPIMLDVPPMVQ